MQSGSHEELLHKDGAYARLFEMQTDAEFTKHQKEDPAEC